MTSVIRTGTPAQFQRAMQLRLKAARESLGLSIPDMARALSMRSRRAILSNTYSKWERVATIPLDLVLHVCDIAAIHPYRFIAPVDFFSDNARTNLPHSYVSQQLLANQSANFDCGRQKPLSDDQTKKAPGVVS